MMKRKIMLILAIIIGGYLFTTNKNAISDEKLFAVYVNDELQSSIPKKGEALFKKAVCDNDVNVSWNNDSWSLLINNLKEKTKCNLYFSSLPIVYSFDYTGSEQTFTAPVSGIYRLEVWGAQGGNGPTSYIGGFGGYSSGEVSLKEKDVIFINVGGMGEEFNGGYNGGGARENNNWMWRGGAGGGATSIANNSGLLKVLQNTLDNILIVSGGGGGACGDLEDRTYDGGSGGGFAGTSLKSIATPGNQITAGTDANNLITASFGQGGLAGNEGGGGGGFYGGGSGKHNSIGYSGAGGSGYIGNTLLTNKVMYCYNCEESSEENTKTISTTCNEETPTDNCSKKGNGYARITLISVEE